MKRYRVFQNSARRQAVDRADLSALPRFLLRSLWLGLYVLALHTAYKHFIAPLFGYLGYHYHPPRPEVMLTAYLLLIVTSLTLPRRVNKAADIILVMMFIIVVTPVMVVPVFSNDLDSTQILGFCVVTGVVFWILTLMGNSTAFAQIIPIRSRGGGLFWGLVIGVSAVTYTVVLASFGLRFNLMSVFEVLDTRLLYRDEVAPSIPALGYLVSNQGNVINPLLMGIGAARRRWHLALAGVIGQLLLYSITGYRTSLLSIPLLLTLGLILRHRKTLSVNILLFATGAVAFTSMAIDRILDVNATNLIVNRMMITAGHLTPYYLETYSNGRWAYWAYSFMAPFIENPYETTPGFHVAITAFGRPDIQANANLFADGYANLGYTGIALEALFLGALLMFLNSAGRGLPMDLVFPTLLVVAFGVANGSPFTGVLSYGVGLAIVLFATYPRDDSRSTSDAPTLGALAVRGAF